MKLMINQVFHKEYPFNNACNWIEPIGVSGFIPKNGKTDNSGNNINHLNAYYCELTVLFHMWKNLSYDAVGLYHYRRYLNFKLDDSWITHRTPGIPVFAPDSDLINYLTDVEQEQQIRNLLSVTDVIIPKKNPLNPTIKEQYISSTAIEPWNAFEEKINEKYFSLNNPSKYFQIVRSTPICNMFIMKKEIFNSYCKDLFEVINHVFQKIGTPYDSYGNRYPGFLAERFLGFWLHINKIPYIEAPIIEMK